MAEPDYIGEVLESIGNDVVETAQRELGATRTVKGKRRRSVSTGNLKDNLTFKLTRRYGKAIFDFGAKGEAADYIRYVIEGRRKGAKLPIPGGLEATGKGRGLNPILDWMKAKNIRLRGKSGGFVKNTPQARRSAAFLIARGISKNGIEPFPFYANAIETVLEKRGSDIEKAIIKQIEFRLKLK